jgi:DNA-directed RNA polymerase subunit RPC12/RpoP
MPLVINSYRCPKCGTPFSYFMKPSTRVRRGIRTPYLKCAKCGQLSAQSFDPSVAAWLWPLAALVLGGAFYVLRTYLSQVPQIVSIAVVLGLVMALIVAIRRGMKLTAVEDQDNPTS